MRDDQARELSDEELIEPRSNRPEGGQSHPEDDDLIPISDEKYLEVIGSLLARCRMLREAYLRGMITASTPDQERQLAELRELLDYGNSP